MMASSSLCFRPYQPLKQTNIVSFRSNASLWSHLSPTGHLACIVKPGVKLEGEKGRHCPRGWSVVQSHGDESKADNPGTDSNNYWLWEKVVLLRRMIAIAAKEEDFEQARRLQNEMDNALAAMSASKLVLLGLLDKAQSHESGVRERIIATQQLGDLGDFAAAPFLLEMLHEPGDIGSVAEASLWSIFMAPPSNPEARLLLHRGMATMSRTSSWPTADQCFTQLITIAPEFAEGWNKRATLRYLMHRFEESISDCKRTLELNPYHFGAASGMGMCLAKVGDYHAALAAFELAMFLNPRLSLESNIQTIKEVIKEGNIENDGRAP